MELAMKMLEKDVCEKQEALVSLRQQLDDLRALKHELAFKLQVGEEVGPHWLLGPWGSLTQCGDHTGAHWRPTAAPL